MRQPTFGTAGFERYAKNTRRTSFLTEMDRTVLQRTLCASVAPVYPKPGNGRPPVCLERMLRIYFLQLRFNLSDPAVEEALYRSVSMRRFAGIDLGREPMPDETRCASSATCWRSTISGGEYLSRCMSILPHAVLT